MEGEGEADGDGGESGDGIEERDNSFAFFDD